MMLEHPERDYRSITKISAKKYSACAPAKLNITLQIGERGSDGMHNLTSTMQAVSLHDFVTLEKVERGQQKIIGQDIDDNIISKAIAELSTEVGEKLYCRIEAPKEIPIGAGLGGGSSDAAAVLRLANEAYGLGLRQSDLAKVAERVGNDITFLLYGGRALVKGAKRHTVTPLEVPRLFYVIARPKMQLSTKVLYELHDKTGKDFTELARTLCPETDKLLLDLQRSRPAELGVTGKGPTAFAAYNSYNDCVSASRRIGWFNGEIFIEKALEPFVN